VEILQRHFRAEAPELAKLISMSRKSRHLVLRKSRHDSSIGVIKSKHDSFGARHASTRSRLHAGEDKQSCTFEKSGMIDK
jgi:hypothetical protein